MRQRRALKIIMTALTIIVCAGLCWSAADIFRAGLARRAALGSNTAPIFTREEVAARLRLIAPALGLWTLGALAAAVTGNLTDMEKAAPDEERLLALQRAWAAELPPDAAREERLRKGVRAVQIVVSVGCAAWALAWLLNRDHFLSWDLESVMGALLAHVLPGVGLACAAALAAEALVARSLRREIIALRRVPRSRERRNAPMRAPGETLARTAARLLLIGAAAALIALGVGNGGLRDVLVKAVNICTECIGLG